MKSTHDSPILVTGAAGAVGAIGRNLTAMLLAKGHKVRALVRREDERADPLRRLVTPLDAAKAHVHGLPLGQAGLMDFDFIPVGPLAPLRMLIAEK